jgi:hypothetical protein
MKRWGCHCNCPHRHILYQGFRLHLATCWVNQCKCAWCGMGWACMVHPAVKPSWWWTGVEVQHQPASHWQIAAMVAQHLHHHQPIITTASRASWCRGSTPVAIRG